VAQQLTIPTLEAFGGEESPLQIKGRLLAGLLLAILEEHVQPLLNVPVNLPRGMHELPLPPGHEVSDLRLKVNRGR
jgi:hypothetical protein